MSQTFAQLKSAVRAIIFPSGEASSLIAAHDKAFIDALIDLQTWVSCLQTDNTSIFPQCSTLYNCGITVFDAPRGRIKKISVIGSEKAPSPSGDIVLTGSFSPQITDPTTAPVSLGAVSSANLYVLETLCLGSACKTKEVPGYFNITINYSTPTGPGILVKRVTLNDCNTVQTDQINVASGSAIYIQIAPVNVPSRNVLGSGGAQLTVNVRQYVASDVLTPTPAFCEEISYKQIEPDYVQKYWNHARQRRFCPSIPFFFGLNPEGSGLHRYPPVPTDATVPAGLAILPLGYSYPQADTDKHHRARVGLWALERQKIYIVPWLNSDESVIVKWDGIKRSWAPADPIDDDPLLIEAVTQYVRKDHFTFWERDPQMAQEATAAYGEARQKLIHECREETRIRGNEPSFARSSAGSLTLFYNNQQTATASCPSGQTGSQAFVTIAAGTVASSLSQADADAQALAQAQQQAQAQLNCQQPQQTYTNTPQTYTATCVTGTGTPVTVTIPAGQFSSVVSQAVADGLAMAAAQTQAQTQLSCAYTNTAQTYTAVCPNQATAGVPTMTSNTTPSGVASSSSVTVGQAYQGFLPAGTQTGGWYATGSLPQWLQYQFTAAQVVTSYSLTRTPLGGYITFAQTPGPSPTPSAWMLQGSTDGTNFTTIDTQSGVVFSDDLAKTFTVANPGLYLYYRILVSATASPPVIYTEFFNITCCLAGLQFFTSQYNVQTTPAGTFTSQISQADADAQAMTAAHNAANTALVCTGGNPTLFYNTAQTGFYSLTCRFSQHTAIIIKQPVIAAGTYSSITSQADANQQAKNAANTLAQSGARGQCQALGGASQ